MKCDLLADGSIDYEGIKQAISDQTKVVGIQRSKGYEDRPSFTIAEIEQMVQCVKLSMKILSFS